MTSTGIYVRLLTGAMLALVLGGISPAQASEPPVVRVRLETTAGAIQKTADALDTPAGKRALREAVERKFPLAAG